MGRAGVRAPGLRGAGGLPRPRHALTKGANWREEQGAGLGARLAARLQGGLRDTGPGRPPRAGSISGAGRGGRERGPPSPTPTPTPRPSSLRRPWLGGAGARGPRSQRRARILPCAWSSSVWGRGPCPCREGGEELDPAGLWLPIVAWWGAGASCEGGGWREQACGLLLFHVDWIYSSGSGHRFTMRIIVEQVRAAIKRLTSSVVGQLMTQFG